MIKKINSWILVLIVGVLVFAFLGACSGDGGSTNPTTINYTVNVNGGSGSGNYTAGANVVISAIEQFGQTFQYWVVNSGSAILEDSNSKSTTFTMPASAVIVTAIFTGGGGSETTAIDGTWNASDGRVATFTGNTFTYKVNGTIKYSGTFSLSGSTITFNATGLGTASGNYSISGTTLTLSNHTWDSTANGTYTKDSGGGGEDGTAWLGNTLKITNAQVYDYNFDNDQYVPFTDTIQDLFISDMYSGRVYINENNDLFDNSSVTLIKGLLNVTLGKPKETKMINLEYAFPYYEELTVSTTGVKVFMISSFDYMITDHEGISIDQSQIISGRAQSFVYYFYCNKDVNITGTVINSTVTMNLKAGWNSIIKTGTINGTTITVTTKTAMPTDNHKWHNSYFEEAGIQGGGGGVEPDNSEWE